MTREKTDSNLDKTLEEHRDEAEVIGRVIQSEQKLSDYFTMIISKSVTDQLDARNTQRLRIIGGVTFALLTIAIPVLLSWVRGTIVEQTESTVEVQLDQASASLETRLEQFLEQERMYSSFTNYLLYLSDRSSVPQSEMTAIRLRLEELAAFSSIVQRAEFPYLLDLATRLAVRHGDKTMLGLLETDFAGRLTSPRTKPRLARYYAQQVLGDRFSSEAKRQKAARRFQQYVDESELAPDFVTLLPLQLMIEDQFNLEEEERVFEGIRLLVRDLAPQEQASFIAETVRYSNPRFWEAATTARTRRLAVVAGHVVINHRHFYITLLDSVAVQTALIDISEAEANKGNIAFATALSGFRNAFSGEIASADDAQFRIVIEKLIHSDIDTWMHDPVIIEALIAQNRETRNITEAQITALESQWQAEFESGAHNLIERVQERHVSRRLRRLKRDSLGMYQEIFVTDAVGLIVGQSDPNSDYFQGEEDKWLQTYRAGPGSMHIGALKFDQSSLAWEVEISLPLLNPDSGKAIGAITIGVNPSMLENSL